MGSDGQQHIESRNIPESAGTLDAKFVNLGGSLKYVRYGRIRHIGTMSCLQSYGIDTDSIITVSDSDVRGLLPGPPVPFKWTHDEWVEGEADGPRLMRQLMVSQAEGNGIEIGAGPYAMAVPLNCKVTYVDNFDIADQAKRMWPQVRPEDIMLTDVVDSFETLATFERHSLDFIVASHVIEHVLNPIGAIRASYERLRAGGFLFLVVPDKRYTFDRDREITSIRHLYADYMCPSKERDFEHHVDYQINAKKSGDTFLEDAKIEFSSGKDIHYHVWTVGSFYALIRTMRNEAISSWSEVWWRPPVRRNSSDLGGEFYFALRK